MKILTLDPVLLGVHPDVMTAPPLSSLLGWPDLTGDRLASGAPRGTPPGKQQHQMSGDTTEDHIEQPPDEQKQALNGIDRAVRISPIKP